MTRSVYIFFCLLGLVLWLSLGYMNFALHTGSGSALEVLLSPSALGPLVLIPLALVQLWKFLTAEREANVLNPHFLFAASQSVLARIGGVVLCAGLFTIGALRLWRSDILPGEPGPMLLNVMFVALGGIGGLWALLSPLIRLTLSPKGLEYSLLRPAQLSWHDVTEVKLRAFMTSSWVEITLKDTIACRSANPFLRWRRVSKVQIHALMFGLDPDILSRGIEARRNVFTF